MSTLGDRIPHVSHFPELFETYFSTIAPRTAKDTIKFAESIWARNGTFAAAMKRVAAYFVTRVEISGVQDREKENLERQLNDELGINANMVALATEYLAYGNCMVSVMQRIDRFLECEHCNSLHAIRHVSDVTFSGDRLHFTCPTEKCGKRSSVDRPKDMKRKGMKGAYIKIWSPHEMHIRHNPVTDRNQYLWEPPADLREAIKQNDRFLLEDTPWEALKAIANPDHVLILNEDQVFHLRDKPLSGIRSAGWGVPKAVLFVEPTMRSLLASVFQSVMMLEYLLPCRVISPAGAGSGGAQDPLLKLNAGAFNSQVLSMLDNHRRNPGGVYALPVPIEYQIVGGEALNADASPHMNYATDEMLNAAGVPAELYKGTLQVQAMPAALRMFEQQWSEFLDQLNKSLNWIVDKLRSATSFNANAQARLQKTTVADSIEHQQIMLQLMAGKMVSAQTALGPLGIDPLRETKLQLQEERDRNYEMARFTREQQQQALYDETMAAVTQPQGGGVGMAGPMGGGAPAAPSTPQDVQAEAEQIAQQMLAMPVEQRSARMKELKHTNPTMHAQVKQMSEDIQQQAKTVGGQQMMAQMAPPPVAPGTPMG